MLVDQKITQRASILMKAVLSVTKDHYVKPVIFETAYGQVVHLPQMIPLSDTQTLVAVNPINVLNAVQWESK